MVGIIRFPECLIFINGMNGGIMADYLSRCACSGRKPTRIKTSSYYPRNNLISRLIKYRHLIRMVIAPTTFGKTSLTFEYAEEMFSFNHVYWLDGTSPCFLRDLDDGSLALSVARHIRDEPSLLIVENLPYLHDERARAFLDLLNGALVLGWEIILTMVPGVDVFSPAHKGIHRVVSQDLLLTDEEVDLRRTMPEIERRPARTFESYERIAGQYWGRPSMPGDIIRNVTNEELSKNALMMAFVMLVLGRGTFDDAFQFMKDKNSDGVIAELQHYSYLQIDSCQEAFKAVALGMETIAAVFAAHLEVLFLYSSFPSKDALILRLADALLGRGKAERACGLMKVFATSGYRALWLKERNNFLFSKGCLLPAYNLFESIGTAKIASRDYLELMNVLRLALLNKTDKVVQMASRIFQTKTLDRRYRILAALVVDTFDEEGCYATEKQYLAAALSEDLSAGEIVREQQADDALEVASLLRIARFKAYVRHDVPQAILFLKEQAAAYPSSSEIGVMLLGYLRRLTEHGEKHSFKKQYFEHNPLFVKDCFRYLKNREQKGLFGLLDCLIVSALEKDDALQTREEFAAFDSALIRQAQDMELSLFQQEIAYESQLKEQDAKREEFKRANPDLFRFGDGGIPLRRGRTTPVLSVELFGGLDVQIGGEPVAPQLFSRQKVKTLFALLILNRGKEVPRDRLMSSLWPDSDFPSAQKNLHATWSLLRKALTTGEGSCPYLVRTQLSYKIESHFVESDVYEFDTLCHTLLFGVPEAFEWAQLYARSSQLYRGDLLPSETKSGIILKAREDYKIKLIDSFAIAAKKLLEIHEYDLARWFAQSAIEHDPTREDAYTVMMEAQIACGRRTAALATFFECKKYLSEELGLDPSAHIKLLYQDILEDDLNSGKRRPSAPFPGSNN